MITRKLLALLGLVLFSLGTVVGCAPPADDAAAPGTTTAEETVDDTEEAAE